MSDDAATEDSKPAPSVLDRHSGEGIEIERKFLVTELPEHLLTYPSERIAQGYLAVDQDTGTVVRLRRRGFHTLMTVKHGGSTLARGEEEFVIDPPRFDRLWSATEGRRIEKVRYKVPVGGDSDLTIELDVFGGTLTGFVLAEVEFPNIEAAEAFRPPVWLRPDVTADRRYANARLAVDGAPDRKAVGEHALLDGEAVDDGVRFVVLAQIDAAADALQGRDAEDYGKAVHTARKAFKRARAVVRIARDGLQGDSAERANTALRDAGRALAGARDALVVIQTLDKLAGRHPDALDAQRIGGLREALVADHEQAERESQVGEGAVDEVLETLGALRGEIEAWDLGSDPAGVVAGGFERIVLHGRKRIKLVTKAGEADGDHDTELLHELRKRAKDLWHAAELVEIAAPKRFQALAEQSHELADHIGDDHDLAVLADQVEGRPGVFGEPADAELLLDLIAKRRRKLQRKALAVAGEIYASKHGRLAERIAELGER
ncbi:MAG: CHAD domain-containing protein [Solirubrobacteraceae bacterium]|nr:CHAD domain-containing protein [Solirubrobacteraceae bacterium]